MRAAKNRTSILAVLLMSATLLSACGGGSGGDTDVAGGGTNVDAGSDDGANGGSGGSGGSGDSNVGAGGDSGGGGDMSNDDNAGSGECVDVARPRVGQKFISTKSALANGIEIVATAEEEVLAWTDTMFKIRVSSRANGVLVADSIHSAEYTISDNYRYETKRNEQLSIRSGVARQSPRLLPLSLTFA